MTVLRSCLFAVAVLAMLAGASGELSPLLSTALWLPSMLALACDPTTPISRAVRRGLQIPVDGPPARIGDAEGRSQLP
jgi:hypothetical protein